jgi:hypothetical protein
MIKKTVKNDFEICINYQMLRVDQTKNNGLDRTRSKLAAMRK